MKVLVINGHPRKGSLSAAFAGAYIEGAAQAGADFRRIDLHDCSFDPNVYHSENGERQLTEEDIVVARALILWAEHVVFIYPVWWGTMPAMLKGFIDRVFISGYAFEEIEGGTGYAPLLTGKTAQLIITMDTPYLVYRFIQRAPGNHAMKKSILQFCGFELAPVLHFGIVKHSTDEQRQLWIDKVKAAGGRLKNGSLPVFTRLRIRFGHWLAALRLQFYPMTFLAYWLGASGATLYVAPVNKAVFWLGYGWVFFLEVATVLSNDYFDYRTDKMNKFFSPFTGGSRTLVEGKITKRSFRLAILSFLLLAFASGGLAYQYSGATTVDVLSVSSILFLLAMGYTTPPLKLVYRGLGELTVCLTHSFAVVVTGFILQGGSITNDWPWLISLPLFFAVFPSIMLSGIPDMAADAANGKRTIAVRVGKKRTANLAIATVWLSLISTAVISSMDEYHHVFKNLLFIAVPHGLLVTWAISRYLIKRSLPDRIDLLMVVTLTYIIWFVLVPLLNLY